MLFALKGIIEESAVPIFLHDGVLVRLCNAEVKNNVESTEILYNSADFQLKDYKLKPGVENSLFWESNRMIVSGKKIVLYYNETELKSVTQTQYNNRIFLFEE